MIVPKLSAWIEERNDLLGCRIDAGQVRSLVQVTTITGQREIRRIVGAPVLPGNDVFDLQCQRRMPLCQPTILASVLSSKPDRIAERGIHRQNLFRQKSASLSLEKGDHVCFFDESFVFRLLCGSKYTVVAFAR